MPARTLSHWLRSLFVPKTNRRARRAGFRPTLVGLETRDVPSLASINSSARLLPPSAFNTGFDAYTTSLVRSIDTATDGLGAIPLIGARLDAATAPVFSALQSANTHLQSSVKSLYASSTGIVGGLQSSLFTVFGPGGANVLQDKNGSGGVTISDVLWTGAGGTPDESAARFSQLDVHLGGKYHVDVPLDLALSSTSILEKMPGLDLRLAANNGVRIEFQWDAYLGVGFDLDTPLGFYFDSTAMDQYGEATPEFAATFSVFAAPPKDAAGNDRPFTGPGLSASAAVGSIQARATDGISERVSVTAEGMKTFEATTRRRAQFSVTLTYEDGSTVTRAVNVVGDGTTALVAAINGRLALNSSPVPIYLLPDFTANDDPTVTTSKLRYVFRTTDGRVRHVAVSVSGNDVLGFAATQYEDQRARSLGFASNATTVDDTLVAAVPVSPTGQLARDVDFTLRVGSTNVPIVIRAANVNGGIGSQAELVQVVQAELNAALQRAGRPRNLTVSVLADGKMQIARTSGSGGLTLSYQSLETSRASVTLAVDLSDDATAGTTAGRIAFKALADAGADALGTLVLPTARAEASVRLHMDGSAGELGGYAPQGLGMASKLGSDPSQRNISLGLPEIAFDFAFDAVLAYDYAAEPDERLNAEFGDPYFYNVELDPGSLLNGLLKPVIGTFNKALGPVLDLIGSGSKLLREPLPVVDQVFNRNISINSMLSNSGVTAQLADYLNFLTSIPGTIQSLTTSFQSAIDKGQAISLGSWYYASKPVAPELPGLKPVAFGLVADGVRTLAANTFAASAGLNVNVEQGGLKVDLLEPANAINLIAGNTFNLVSFNLPSAVIDASIGFATPTLTVGIPNIAELDFQIGGSAGVRITAEPISIRYDSTGLQRMAAEARAGAAVDFRHLLEGVYLDLTRGDSITVSGSIGAGGEAELLVLGERVAYIDADVGGSIFGQVQLQDPTGGDNKIRLHEIFALTKNFSDPLALLSFFHPTETRVGISAWYDIDIEIAGLNVTEALADLGLPNSYSANASLSFGDVFGSFTRNTLPSTQPFGTVTNGVLRVHSGPQAASRLTGDTNGDDGETVVVTSSGSDVTVRINGGAAQTFTGVSRVVVTGGAGDDTINASGLNVPIEIYSGGGNDSLTGGNAADILFGGDGNAVTITATQGGSDVITGGRGAGTISVGGTPKTVHAGSGTSKITLIGSGHTVLTGAGSPTVSGGSDITYLLGTGNAKVTVGSGASKVTDGPGSHTITYPASSTTGVRLTTVGGNDTVFGTAGADVFTATGIGNVTFHGLGGSDTLTGSSGDDTLAGGDGDDVLTGGGGTDTYNLGAGNNTAHLGSGAAVFTSLTSGVDHKGGTGSDAIFGADARTGFHYQAVSGNDTVHGSRGNDTLIGGSGTDVLFGSGGSNTLRGTFQDTLVGGPSVSGTAAEIALQGGAGKDRFILDATIAGQTGVNLTTPGVVAAVGGTATKTVSYKPGDTIEVMSGTFALAVTADLVVADLIFTTQGGNDSFSVQRVTGDVTINAGEGTNTVGDGTTRFVRSITGDVSITTGGGTDNIVVSDITGLLTVSAGAGANTVTASRVSGAVSVTGGAGDDAVTLDDLGAGLTASLGDGGNTVSATDVAGTTTVTTGSGGDTITGTRVAGFAVTSGGADDTITVVSVTGPLTLTPGAGADKLFLTGVSGTSTLTLEGNDVVDVYSATGAVNLTAAAGTVTVNVGSLTAASTFTLNPADGGTTNLTANLLHATKTLTVTGGSTGTRNLTISRAADPASRTYTYNGVTLTTAGQGNVTVGGLSAVDVRLGSGADKVTVSGSSTVFDTKFYAGGGDDQFVVTGVDGSTGDANLYAYGEGGTDTLTASFPTSAPNGTTAAKFAKLAFEVESLVVDNSGHGTAVAWTFAERALSAGGVSVITTTGATDVRLLAGTNDANTLAVSDASANPQRISLGGNVVRIQENPNVVLANPTFVTAASKDALLTGYESLSVSSGGVVTGTGTRTNAAAVFTNPIETNLGVAGYDLLTADLNGDGNTDLLITQGGASSTARLLIGRGDGTFNPAVTLTVTDANGSPRKPAAADIDGDGDLDLIIPAYGNDKIFFLRNNGVVGSSNPFTSTRTSIGLGGGPIDVAVADMNRDGYLDLVVAQYDGNGIVIARGDGTFGFPTGYTILSSAGNPASVALGDLNGDGKIDIVTNNPFANSGNNAQQPISVHLNTTSGTGAPTFATRATYITSGSPRVVDLYDIDGDGDLDVYVPTLGTTNYFLNNGNGTFAAFLSSTPDDGKQAMVVGDFNGDGLADMVSSTASETVLFNYGPTAPAGAFSYGYAGQLSFPGGPTNADARFVAADFNNDGLSDIAFTEFSGQSFSIMLAVNPTVAVRNAVVTTATIRGLGYTQTSAISADGVFSYSNMSDGRLFTRNLTTNAVVPNAGAYTLRADDTLVVTADNISVYALAPSLNDVLQFHRNTTTGALSYLGEFDVGADPTDLTTFGSHAYVTLSNGGVVRLFRDVATSQITASFTIPGTTSGLASARKVLVSEDGLNVYVFGTTAAGVAGIASFTRNTSSGFLTFVEFVANGSNGVSGLRDVVGMASRTITDTGGTARRFLFFVSQTDNALVVLRHDPAGRLLPYQKVTHGFAGATGLFRPTGLQLHGNQLIVSSAGDGTVDNPGGVARYNLTTSLGVPSSYNFAFGGALQSLALTSGSGDDSYTLSPITGVNQVTVNSGGGADVVSVANTAAASKLTLNTGDAGDLVAVTTIGNGSTLTVDGGAGDDRVTLSATGTGATVTLSGGDGADSFAIDGSGIKSALRVNGNTSGSVDLSSDSLFFDAQSNTINPASAGATSGTTTRTVAVNVAGFSTVTYQDIQTFEKIAGVVVTPRLQSPATVLEGSSVTLTIDHQSGVSVQSYEWDIDGDGSFGDRTGRTITLSWADLVARGLDDDGTYRIAARLTQTDGIESVGSFDLTISDTAPTPSAVVAAGAKALSPVSVTLSATDPSPSDPISKWVVSWGDGSANETYFAASPTVTNVYDWRGNYFFEATAFDDAGVTVSTTRTLVVDYADLSASGSGKAAEDSPYSLTLNLAGVAIASWGVDWSGGTSYTTYPASQLTATKTYTQSGTFTPRVRATTFTTGTSGGTTDVTFQAGQVVVSEVGPVAAVSGPATAAEHSTYTLTLSATPVGSDTFTGWTINWGDGTTTTHGNVATATRRYVDEGQYTITATAIESSGASTVANLVSVAVTNVAPTVVLAPDTFTLNEGGTISLTHRVTPSSANPADNDLVSLLVIDWGDGTPTTEVNNPSTFPTSQLHTYSVPGRYTVSARTVTPSGEVLSGETTLVVVNDTAPTFSLAGGTAVPEGTSYTLTLNVTPQAADPVVGWNVVWGDGTTEFFAGTPSSVTHVYADDGTYPVSAALVTATGSYLANAVSATVTPVAPTVTLSAPPTVNEGSSFVISASAANRGSGRVVSWLVDWNDGTVETFTAGNETFAHTYADGTKSYVVSVTATDDSGQTTTTSQNVTVQDVAPTVELLSNPVAVEGEEGEEGKGYVLKLRVTDLGTGSDDLPATVRINWGDGVIEPNRTYTVTPDSVTGELVATFTHWYKTPGTFPVSVRPSLPVAGAFRSQTATILYAAPSIAATGTVVGAAPGFENRFNENTPTNYSLRLDYAARTPGLTKWEITWGDGSAVETIFTSAASVTVPHTFPAMISGERLIRAVAFDASGSYELGVKYHVNDRPTLAGSQFFATIDEDTSHTGGVSITDADDTTHTLQLHTAPSNGTVTFEHANRQYTYTPNANFNGSDFFRVSVSDGLATSNFIRVNMTVAPVNDAPVLAGPFDIAPSEDTPLTVNVPVTDVDSTGFTFAVVTAPTKGTVTFNAANKTFTYTPTVLNFAGTDTFTFRANDGTANSNVATVNVTYIPVNDAPVAAGGSRTTPEDTALTGTLTATDVDSANLTYALATGPSKGTVTVLPNGQYTYTPADNFFGSDSFSFTASDSSLTSAPATISISVSPVNDTPVAAGQTLSTAEDTALSGTVTGSDVETANPTFALVTVPTKGTVTLLANGQFTYTPAANYNGADSFTFTASDGTLTSAPATVSISVTSVNDAPVAVGGSGTTAEDAPLSGTVAGTDVDSASLTYSVATAPQFGTVTVQPNGQFTYTPATDYFGPDSFTFRVNDGSLDSAPATVSLTVSAVNDAPVALAGSGTTAEDTALTGTLAGSDVDSPALTYVLVTAPSKGTVSILPGGTYTYTPNADYFGTDSFTFRVNDGSLDSAPAMVSLTVSAVNDAPVALAGSGTTAEDTALTGAVSGSDVDSATLTFALATAPSKGTVTILPSGQYTYTPNTDYFGTDTFTFTASDGSLTSAAATVSVTVSAVNDVPAAAGNSYSTPRGRQLTVAAPGVLGNDADVDSPTLRVVSHTQPASGVVAVAADGGLVYTPTATFTGLATFQYDVTDDQGGTTTATVTIEVQPRFEATISGGAATLNEGDTTTFGSTVVDAAPVGTPVYSWTATRAGDTSPAASGSAATFAFTPADDGLYTITLSVTDGVSTSGDQRSLTASNIAPTANFSVSGPVVEGSSAVASLAATDAAAADRAAGLRYSFATTTGELATSYTAASPDASQSFPFADDGTYTLYARVFDKDGGFSDFSRTVTVANVAPNVTAAGNVTAGEGSVAKNTGTWGDPGQDTVALTASVGTVSANPDGTWSWSLGVGDGPAPTQTVTITATDSDGAATTTTFTLVVLNVAPAAAVTGPATGGVGKAQTFTLLVADPSAADQAAGFTFTIDWDGNGIIDQTVSGFSGMTVSRTFADEDAYDVRVTATDRDGGTSAPAVFTIDITDDGNPGGGAGTAIVNAAGNLVVTGTSGNDEIRVRHTSVPGQVRVRINRQTVGTFTLAADRMVEVYGLAGDDRITVSQHLLRNVFVEGGDGRDRISGGGGRDTLSGGAGDDTVWARWGDDAVFGGAGDDSLRGGHGNDSLYGGDGEDTIHGGGGNDLLDGGTGDDSLQAGDGGDTLRGGDGDDTLRGGEGTDWVYGGAGNDSIRGGSGNDILLGEAGNDLILGGSGRDLMIGGTGADRIEGNSEEDILIAGTTAFDLHGVALQAIHSAWTANASYADRVASISNGTGLAAGYRLVGDDGAGQTVFNDDSADTLTGGGGIDWFFANRTNDNGGPIDCVTDKRAEELWSDTDF